MSKQVLHSRKEQLLWSMLLDDGTNLSQPGLQQAYNTPVSLLGLGLRTGSNCEGSQRRDTSQITTKWRVHPERMCQQSAFLVARERVCVWARTPKGWPLVAIQL